MELFLNIRIYKQYLKFIAGKKFEIYDGDNVFYLKSKINNPLFNYILVDQQIGDEASKVLANFAKSDISAKLIILPLKDSNIYNTEISLTNFHLRKSFSKDLSSELNLANSYKDLVIKDVKNVEDLEIWSMVASQIHGHESSLAQKFFGSSFDSDKLKLTIGYLNEKAVAISLLFIGEGLAVYDWNGVNTGLIMNKTQVNEIDEAMLINNMKIAKNNHCSMMFGESIDYHGAERFKKLKFHKSFFSAHMIFEPVLNLI